MARDPKIAAKFPDPVREAVGLEIGPEGAFFVGSTGEYGQDWKDSSVIDHNKPPKGQPGLWCQWIPNADGTALKWDEGEKFYEYRAWLAYLIENFLGPWGYVLNGEVEWRGEDPEDYGKIGVEANRVWTRQGLHEYAPRKYVLVSPPPPTRPSKDPGA